MNPFEKFKSAAQVIREAVPALPDWDRHSNALREGERLLELGRFADAEACLAGVAGQLRQRTAPGPRLAKVLYSLAVAQFRQGKLAEARESAESARRLMADGKPRMLPELSACLDLLGSLALEEGDAEAASRLFVEALETQKSVQPPSPVALTERYRHLANAHWQAGRLNEASGWLLEATGCAERKLGAVHPLTAECYLEYGQCLSEIGDHAGARAALEKALAIHQQIHGPDSDEAARDLQALAVACRAAGDLEAAISFYEKALGLRERQVGGNSSEFASLLMGLADIHSVLGRYAQSLELLQQAVCKLQGTRDDRLAPVLETLGTTYAQCGRFKDAATCLRKARQIWERSPETNAEALESNSKLIASLSPYLAEVEDSAALPSIFKEEILEKENPAPEPAPAESLSGSRPLASRQSWSQQAPAGWATGAYPAGEPVSPPIAPPPPSHLQPGGVRLHFVRPDGSPAGGFSTVHAPFAGGAMEPATASLPGAALDASAGTGLAPGPIHLTVVVPAGGLPATAQAVVTAPPQATSTKPMKGWEELAFHRLAR